MNVLATRRMIIVDYNNWLNELSYWLPTVALCIEKY